MVRGLTQLERRRRRAAKRAAAEPFLVASALAAYQRRYHVKATTLAAWLGCPPASWSTLALCARPDPAAARFQAEVQCIATAVGCDPERLAVLLEAVAQPPRHRPRPVAG